MALRLQSVQVATGFDEEGMLVFVHDRLVAVLVQLSDAHEELGITGYWFMETRYGFPLTEKPPLFPDLDAAQAWIGQQLTEG